VLATLNGMHVTGLAVLALETQHNFLGRLRLLVENGLGLTSISGLLSVVTALSCNHWRNFVQLGCIQASLKAELVLELMAGERGISQTSLRNPFTLNSP